MYDPKNDPKQNPVRAAASVPPSMLTSTGALLRSRAEARGQTRATAKRWSL